MKPVLSSACVWIGGMLLAIASGLFWYVVLVPDLPVRTLTIATAATFAAGVLLVTVTPLVAAARTSAPAPARGGNASRQTEPSLGKPQVAAKLLIWLILASYIVIAMLR